MDNINRRHEMPLQGIMVVQIFYVWGIDFVKIPYNFYNIFIICLGYKSSQMGIFRELIND